MNVQAGHPTALTEQLGGVTLAISPKGYKNDEREMFPRVCTNEAAHLHLLQICRLLWCPRNICESCIKGFEIVFWRLISSSKPAFCMRPKLQNAGTSETRKDRGIPTCARLPGCDLSVRTLYMRYVYITHTHTQTAMSTGDVAHYDSTSH